jgi:hypothetical protein
MEAAVGQAGRPSLYEAVTTWAVSVAYDRLLITKVEK